MHTCFTSPAYIFNHTLFTDLFHVTNEQHSSEVPPKIFLAFHTNTENLNQIAAANVCDYIVFDFSD